MRVSKIVLLAVSVSLLAVGCSKTNKQSENPKPAVEPVKVAVSGTVPKDWVTLVHGVTERWNLAMPKTWVTDAETTEQMLIIRSSAKADGTKPGDTIMSFAVQSLTKGTIQEQVLFDTKDFTNVSKPVLGRTQTDLVYAKVAYTDSTSKVKDWSAYAVRLGGNKYVLVRAGSNGVNPDIETVVKSIRNW